MHRRAVATWLALCLVQLSSGLNCDKDTGRRYWRGCPPYVGPCKCQVGGAGNPGCPLLRCHSLDHEQLKSVLRFLDRPIHEFVLTNYKNSTIVGGAFKGTDIWLLNLRKNGIDDIQGGAFSGLKNLRSLTLSENALRSVTTGLLSGTGHQLEYLLLDWNKIEQLDSNIFLRAPKLRHLYLDFNQLVKLKSGTFHGLTQLSYLWLNNNNISTLRASSLDPHLNTSQVFLRLDSE